MVLFTGCWNYREVNDRSIVAGTAVDYDKETGEIILTVETANAHAEANSIIINSDVYKSRGKDLFDAIRNMISITSQKLYWSHNKVLILSMDILENEKMFKGVLDWFIRDSEPREDMWIFLSEEKTASEIFTETKVKTENVTGFYLEDLAQNEEGVSKYIVMPLYEFIEDLNSTGKSAVIPTVKIDFSDENLTPIVFGQALLKGIKADTRLSGEETKMLLILKNRLKGGLLTLKSNIEGEEMDITLEVSKSKTKLTPQVLSLKNKDFRMKVEVKLDVVIAEVGGGSDVIKESNREKLKVNAEKILKQRLQNMLEVLKECKCDAAGYGKKFEIKYPKVWKQIEPEWSNFFPLVKSEIKVDITITGTALRAKPIVAR